MSKPQSLPSLPLRTRGRQRRHKVKGVKRQRRTAAQTDGQINHSVRRGDPAPGWNSFIWCLGGFRRCCGEGYTRVCRVQAKLITNFQKVFN